MSDGSANGPFVARLTDWALIPISARECVCVCDKMKIQPHRNHESSYWWHICLLVSLAQLLTAEHHGQLSHWGFFLMWKWFTYRLRQPFSKQNIIYILYIEPGKSFISGVSKALTGTAHTVQMLATTMTVGRKKHSKAVSLGPNSDFSVSPQIETEKKKILHTCVQFQSVMLLWENHSEHFVQNW